MDHNPYSSEAEDIFRLAHGVRMDDGQAAFYASAAQVQATLAVAYELRGLFDLLEEHFARTEG